MEWEVLGKVLSLPSLPILSACTIMVMFGLALMYMHGPKGKKHYVYMARWGIRLLLPFSPLLSSLSPSSPRLSTVAHLQLMTQ